MRVNKNSIITIVVIIVVGVGAFVGGMQYQKSQASSSFALQPGTQVGRFGGQGRKFGMATVGQVVSQDANSITVKLQDGSSKIINLLSSTRINKTQPATAADLTTGTTVAVFGQTNSDGSVTAQSVQINPQQRPGQPGAARQ